MQFKALAPARLAFDDDLVLQRNTVMGKPPGAIGHKFVGVWSCKHLSFQLLSVVFPVLPPVSQRRTVKILHKTLDRLEGAKLQTRVLRSVGVAVLSSSGEL